MPFRPLAALTRLAAFLLAAEAILRQRHRQQAARIASEGLLPATGALAWDAVATQRRLVVLGDSVVHGGGQGWVQMVADALAAQRPGEGWQVINAGIGGDTALQGLARLERDALAWRPHLLLVAFGLNDMYLARRWDDVARARRFPRGRRAALHRSHLWQTLAARARRLGRREFPEVADAEGADAEPRTPPDLFVAALQRIRQQAAAQGAAVRVLTMPPLDGRFRPDWPEPRRQRQRALHAQYNDLLRAVAGEALIDVGAAFAGHDLSPLLEADGLHPSAVGHRRIADAVLAALPLPKPESDAPFFSVIIPNWNGAKHLPTCFAALRRQTYPRYEIILVDNGSTDVSRALVEEQYPDVRWLGLPENRGLTGACNAAARVARGDVLVMLNNDTEVDGGWLAALAAALQRHPGAGAVASKLLLFDRRNVIHSAGDGFGRDGIPRNRGVWETDNGQYDGDVEVFGACGGAVAYRRAAWEDVGGFDETLFMYCEDVDISWRLRLRGWPIVFAPAARVYHHLSATGGGPIASYYTGRNTLTVLLKDVPSPLLRRYGRRMSRAQARVAWDALRAWRGAAARARLRGQLAALARLPQTWRQRQQVQATRRVPVADIEHLFD